MSNFSARAVRKLMLGPFHGSSGVHATTFPSLLRIYGDRLRFPAGGRERARSGSTKAREEGHRPLRVVTTRPGILERFCAVPRAFVCIFVFAYAAAERPSQTSPTKVLANRRRIREAGRIPIAGKSRNDRPRTLSSSCPVYKHRLSFPLRITLCHFAPLLHPKLCHFVSPYDPLPRRLRYRYFRARPEAARFIFLLIRASPPSPNILSEQMQNLAHPDGC